MFYAFGSEKGLSGLLPISDGRPSRPPASHPFLSWLPSLCPETVEAPGGITVRKVGGWPHRPCLGRHGLRPDPEGGDSSPNRDSGEARPHSTRMQRVPQHSCLHGNLGWCLRVGAARQDCQPVRSLGGWRDELVQASRQQSQVNVALGGHVPGEP